MIFHDKFTVIVKPGSKKNEFLGKDEKERFKINLKEKAIDNKANLGLIKFFKKEFGLNIRIKTGLKSKEKVICCIK